MWDLYQGGIANVGCVERVRRLVSDMYGVGVDEEDNCMAVRSQNSVNYKISVFGRPSGTRRLHRTAGRCGVRRLALKISVGHEAR
jgi:hypothetical protein